jgi:hypothetical protein
MANTDKLLLLTTRSIYKHVMIMKQRAHILAAMIVSTIQAKPKQILSKSVTLAARPTSTQQFRQGRVRELAMSCGILDLKNMQRDKLTSDPKYFETCLTSLYSYITYYTDKHKPFTTTTPE